MSTGRIVRQVLPFERNFTQIPNAWVRDHRLTLKTRGLLAMLWSLPVGHKVTIQAMSKAGHGSRDLITRAVRELEEHGYLTRTPRRSRGSVIVYDWLITDPLEIHEKALLTPREPVDNYVSGNEAREIDVPGNESRDVPGNKAPIKNTKNTLNNVLNGTNSSATQLVDNTKEREARSLPGETCVAGHRLVAGRCELACRADRDWRDRVFEAEQTVVHT